MKRKKKCNCPEPYYARGYCKKCYQRGLYQGWIKPRPRKTGIRAGKKIKERLYAAVEYANGRTCADIARELGVSRQRVHVWLRGRSDRSEIRKRHRYVRNRLKSQGISLKALNRTEIPA